MEHSNHRAMGDASTAPSQRVDPWAAEQWKKYFRCISLQSHGHTVTIARPLRFIYQHPIPTGLARCLTTFPTVSTLQDCNFTSLSLETFCSGFTILAASSSRLLLHTWIWLACIRIQFFAGNVAGLAFLCALLRQCEK